MEAFAPIDFDRSGRHRAGPGQAILGSREMADILTPTGGVPISFGPADRRTSREGAGVYVKNFTAYKLFRSRDQATAAAARARAAKAAGVPVVGYARQYEATFEADGKARTVYVLETERCIGTFFQLAKGGHVTRIVAEIRQAARAQPGLIPRAIRGFAAARDHGLTDPQGFFDATQGMPIKFFDVHRAGLAASQIQQVINDLNP
jgi:hypothetical protein